MRVHTRSLGVTIAFAAALTLGGCSAVGDVLDGDEPKRDDTGAIVEADEADVFALLVGDCMNYLEADEVQTVESIPCGEAHDSEAYAVMNMPDGEYPGEDAIGTAADEFCYAEFPAFVGIAWEDSALDYWPFTPTQTGWEEVDDREILCFVRDLEGGVIGTLKGAAR